MVMESDLSALLQQDIAQTRHRLQEILSNLSSSACSPQSVQEGLTAAHTLKALAAVQGVPHLEQYAAQLEQLFLKARQLEPDAVHAKILPWVKTIEREFRSACELAQQEPSAVSPEQRSSANKLASLVDQLHHLDQRRVEQRYQSHLQQVTRENTDCVLLESLFRSFLPWLQQASTALQKEVQVEIKVSSPVTLQPSVATRLQVILVHLLRNALFHGVESAEIREWSGKSKTGTIELCAEIDGDNLVVSVSDDGQGVIEQSTSLARQRVESKPCLFQPASGQGTETAITETSIYAVTNSQTGLGVGLYIVRTQAEGLGGDFKLHSIPQVGTSATLQLPLQVCREMGGDE